MSNPTVTAHHADLDSTVRIPRSALPFFDGYVEVDADGNEVEVVDADAAEELKGDALTAALEQRGLPKTGNADEKRARIVEHDANPAGTPHSDDEHVVGEQDPGADGA